jgi:glutamate racemase
MPRHPQQRPRVLVFDSGLGGLSIVAELVTASLNVDIYYLADTAYFPYGEKSDAALIDRVPALIARAVAIIAADLVIIACNTASTLALEKVRRGVNVPIVGVVPAIKPAVALTNSGVIGLLATPNTVRRPYTDQLILDFAAGKNVVRHGAIGLAATVEAMMSGGTLDHAVVKASVQGLFTQKDGEQIDVVVLACTHYPLVRAELASFAPRPVLWVDSGAAIARRTASLLGLTNPAPTDLRAAFTTGGIDDATALGLQNFGFAHTKRLG